MHTLLQYYSTLCNITLVYVTLEALITPEQFAEQLCDDLDLPASQFMAPVATQIRQQCEQFTSDLITDDGDDRRVVIKVNIVQITGLE